MSDEISQVAGKLVQNAGVRMVKKIVFYLMIMPIGGIVLVGFQLSKEPPRRGPPQLMSVDEFLAKNYGDGVHIALTDFRFDRERIKTNFMGSPSHWEKAFIPLVAKDDPTDSKARVRIMLETESAHTPEDLTALEVADRVEGYCRLGSTSLSITEAIGSGVHDDTYLLKHNVQPPTPLGHYGLIGLGVVMALSGLPLYYVAWRAIRQRQP